MLGTQIADKMASHDFFPSQHGPVWRALIGGGFLVSPSLEFTSRDTVFLYPDCRTGTLKMRFPHEAEFKSKFIFELRG